MARNEADRDDLFAEAIALVRRCEVRISGGSVPLLAGFKAQGDVSFYFGPDRVYHCDEQGRFRRAFIDGVLYRSQESGLSRLRRERTNAETTLWRAELTPEETIAFRAEMIDRLTHLRQALLTNELVILRRCPPEDDRLEADLSAAIATIIDAFPWLAPALVVRR